MANKQATPGSDPALDNPNAPEANAMLVEQALHGKFQCTEVGIDKRSVHLRPETNLSLDGTGNGNESWADGRPEGFISLVITNEEMQGFFMSGKHYRVSIIAIEEPTVTLDLQ